MFFEIRLGCQNLFDEGYWTDYKFFQIQVCVAILAQGCLAKIGRSKQHKKLKYYLTMDSLKDICINIL